MSTVVSTLTTLGTFPFRNAAGALVTGKVNADFTKRVLKDGAVSAVAATVTEVATLSGYYSTSLTPTAVGNWTVIVEYTADPTFAWTESFDVIPAAADGAALATAIAAIMDQPVSDFTDSTTLGGRIKMITAGSRH